MIKLLIILLITLALLLTSCSDKNKTAENTSSDNGLTAGKEDTASKETTADKEENTVTPTKAASGETTDADQDSGKNLPSEESSAEVTNGDGDSAQDAAGNEGNKAAIITVNAIPSEELIRRKDHCGSIEQINYQTHDYFGDGSEITKTAYVYIPCGYDEGKQYNVLYLMHGIGGDEKEWGMYNDSSQVKIMMDNLIYKGEIEPFLIVTPNGRSEADFSNPSSDYNSFYVFGKELRNDLIPYIDSKYSTYADYADKGYDLTAARDHRAMAGLSMGGMQTINIGICESLDIVSYFGAFSACPTTNASSKTADMLKGFPDYNINFFYNICGTEDNVALSSASSAVASLTALTDKLADGKNFIWQKVGGSHDFNVWYLGFYNFAKIAFKDYTKE